MESVVISVLKVVLPALVIAVLPPVCLAAEKLDRGLTAIVNSEGKVYLGWRLLASDPPDVAFHVYRRTARGRPVRVSSQPVRTSTNLVDAGASLDERNAWFVRPVVRGREQEPSPTVTLSANAPADQTIRFKLQGNYLFNRVGIADLDGDGVFDYVIKQPGAGHGLDPGTIRPSPDTFKLEAYNGRTREFMWRYNLGWNMNMGVWWTPFVVADFDGDGKAEVALKAAPYAATRPEARISPGGFVLEGAEYILVLNGATGKEIDHADWVERGDPRDWGDDRGNRVNRNQIGLAKLDGKRTSILVARGTYTKMYVDAFNLVNGKLVKTWRWFGDDSDPRVRGQGAHGMHVYDFDSDGKEEILLGSVMVDDNGKTLWSSGMGHPDVFYVADILPERPGLEIAYGYEDRQTTNGIQVADARTGRLIWGHRDPTAHIHDQGMLADIDASNPGYEFYVAEQRRTLGQWLYSARDGKLLSTADLGSITLIPFYWLDGPQKVYHVFSYRGNTTSIRKHGSDAPAGELPGRIVAVADVLGDWREELILTVEGELRIATTTVPSTSRHVTLMQDSLYRNDVALAAMGYFLPPNTSRTLFPEAFR
jgi:rhamnogalacturonan endolyase